MNNEKVLSKETIQEDNPTELKDTMQCLVEWISLSIDDQTDEQETFLNFLDVGIDTYDAHIANLQYDLSCMANVLSGFVTKHKLENQFKEYISEIKSMQNDPKDVHEVNKEMYGDIDELFKDYPDIHS
ncbi:MAG: hypothetical protein ACI35O_08135 [Bacillaceae bacterium]